MCIIVPPGLKNLEIYEFWNNCIKYYTSTLNFAVNLFKYWWEAVQLKEDNALVSLAKGYLPICPEKTLLIFSEWREVIALHVGVVSNECISSLKDHHHHHHLWRHHKTTRTCCGLSYRQRNELMSIGDTSEVAHANDSLLSQCHWKICNSVPGMVLSFAKLQILIAVTGHMSPALTGTLSSRPGQRPPAQTNKRAVQPFLLTLHSPNPVWIGFGDATITEGDVISTALVVVLLAKKRTVPPLHLPWQFFVSHQVSASKFTYLRSA